MEKSTAELRKLFETGECDAIVFDYLEKVSASKRQLQLYGTNMYQREADNVEQIKTFAETTGIPVLMIAQMSKSGKSESFNKLDRTDMRGAGEKSDKANLVVMLKRERSIDGYSNQVEVLVDKNTMGSTGAFRQMMQPEYYRVGDLT
jgi:replicative DNA helicase